MTAATVDGGYGGGGSIRATTMEIRTLKALTTCDERALRFTPLGLSLAGTMKPEFAADYVQRTVAIPLAGTLPDSTRSSFERLRTTHIYGLFEYELFTAAHDMAPLVLEQAVGERFVAYYEGAIPLIDGGTDQPLQVTQFREVQDAFRSKGSHQKGRWFVKSIARPGSRVRFRATYAQLFAWARHEHLLDGQRSCMFDRAMVRQRVSAAHPSRYHLVSPVDSARMIWQVGEIVNRLWGERTPGGRIFPLPVRREVFAVGWSPDGTTVTCCRCDQLATYDDGPDWQYIVVKAAEADEELFHFDSDFEFTHYPAELLWGPGTRVDAITWLDLAEPTGDAIQHIDREFLIRFRNGVADPPRSPAQFLGLPEKDRPDNWYLIRADRPHDAHRHVRVHVAEADCAEVGPCENCWVSTIKIGTWESVAAQLESGPGQPPINVRVPARFSL